MRVATVRRAALATWLTVISTGCMAWRLESVPPRELLKTPGIEAVRVTRADKSKVEIYDPVLQGDSIIGHPTDRAIARLAMPLSQVETISTRHQSIGRTLLITLGVAGAIAVYGLLQTLNQGY